MQSIRSRSHLPIRALVVASSGLLALSQAACGLFSSEPTQVMVPSAGNISGEGTVSATAGENGNTQLDVRVKHLPAASKVAADASVYIVWIKPRNGEIQNVGALQVDDDLVGKLKTTTPHRAFTLTVTPEPSARMAAPTHRPVFTSEIDRAE